MDGLKMQIAHRNQIPTALKLRGKICVEVGVFKGDYSGVILDAMPGMLYLVDPWKHQSESVYPDDTANLSDADFEAIYKHVEATYGKNKRVEIVREESMKACHRYCYNELDFVYVDAIHTPQSVLTDLACWWGLLREGGWMCGHDYTGKYTGVRD